MGWPSDELREFGDAIEAGQGSKIKEPEPEAWVKQAAFDRTMQTLHDIDAPTGPLTPGQVKCVSCRENDRTRAASSALDGLCHFCRDSGDARHGHQFHFQVMVQGAYRGPDGIYHDAPEPVEYTPFTLTVRAWNLAAACRKAAETPFKDWKLDGEEQ